MKLCVYEVYSSVYPYAGPEEVHGMCLAWNTPGDSTGAVQLRDRICEEYYRKGKTAYVGIRERHAEIDPLHLRFL